MVYSLKEKTFITMCAFQRFKVSEGKEGMRLYMNVGIDLGGSHIGLGVVDKNGLILEKVEKRITIVEKKNIKKTIESYIIENVEKWQQKYKLTNIGIAVPGTVKEGTVVKSVNLGLENYKIVDALQKEIKLPIVIKNDAKCAALGENAYGCLKKYTRSIFLTLGTGIGGAVIIDNKLLNTGDLPGCEFGHMIIEKNGILCNCGKKGCFEKYASMKALKNRLRKELNLDETTRGQVLLDKIRNNTKSNPDYNIIEKIIKEFIQSLAIGISNLINIFEPEAIGIGGSFVFFEDILLDRLKDYIISNNLLFNPRKDIKIETAILENNAGIVGASIII